MQLSFIKPKTRCLLYVPSGLTFKNSTFCLLNVLTCFIWLLECTALPNWFLWSNASVLTVWHQAKLNYNSLSFLSSNDYKNSAYSYSHTLTRSCSSSATLFFNLPWCFINTFYQCILWLRMAMTIICLGQVQH